MWHSYSENLTKSCAINKERLLQNSFANSCLISWHFELHGRATWLINLNNMVDHSLQGVTVKSCYNKKRLHHKSNAFISLLISSSGIRHYFHKVHTYSSIIYVNFWVVLWISLNLLYTLSQQLHFFYGNGNELSGGKGPPTN